MRDGRRIVDTDTHQMEPAGMWEKYIEPRFRGEAPRRARVGSRDTIVVEGGSLTAEEGKYPFNSPEFIAALSRGMKRFERATQRGFDPASRYKIRIAIGPNIVRSRGVKQGYVGNSGR